MTPLLLDTTLVIIMLLSILIALFRGFVKEVLTIVNLLGASAAAYLLSPMAVPGFKNWLASGAEGAEKAAGEATDKADYIFGVIPPDVMAVFLAYAAVFFGVFLILSLAGMAISGGVKSLGLGGLDRTLGIVFGALRGYLFIFLVYAPFAFALSPEKMPTWVTGSMSHVALDKTYKVVDGYFRDGTLPDVKEAAAKAVEDKIDTGAIREKLENMAPEQNGENTIGTDINGKPLNAELLQDERE